MAIVEFHDIGTIPEEYFKFVVIQAEYKGKWIVVRHEERDTWEIPGGHIEDNESSIETASRELQEETGAIKFSIQPICPYTYYNKKKKRKSHGQLFYSKVQELGNLPDSEIEEIKFVTKLPKKLTYPLIQPLVFQKVKESILIKDIL